MSRKVSITYKTPILTGAEPIIWWKIFALSREYAKTDFAQL